MSEWRLPRDDKLIQQRLARACELSGTHSLADVAATIKAGHAQWWCNGDGAAVTEIQDFPQVRLLNYWLVAGELRACLRMQPRIDAWAMEQGCTAAIARGRWQWGNVGRPYGWEADSVLFKKPLIRGGSA